MGQPTIIHQGPQVTWRQIVVAGIVGNVMEWYDFAVYGYLAPTLGRHFFPSKDAVASVLAMAVPTFLIGVLPDRAQIGVAASAVLVVLRLVQGLSVGGEYAASVVFLVEGAAPDRRGLMGSWGGFGGIAGILLGSAVGALISSVLSADAFYAWGWRVPFVLGLGVGLTGLLIRRRLPQMSARPGPEQPPGSPIVEAFRTQWRAMLGVAGGNVLNAVGFYLVFVYVVTYLRQIVDVRAAEALDINTLNMVILLLVMPAAGTLSDRLGRKPLLLGSALGMLVLAWPLFWLIHHPTFGTMLIGQMGFAVLIGLFLGVLPATMVEAFPARVRCSALALGYNVCLGVIGGTTPMAVTYLIARSHDDLSTAFYLMLAAAISLG